VFDCRIAASYKNYDGSIMTLQRKLPDFLLPMRRFARNCDFTAGITPPVIHNSKRDRGADFYSSAFKTRKNCLKFTIRPPRIRLVGITEAANAPSREIFVCVKVNKTIKTRKMAIKFRHRSAGAAARSVADACLRRCNSSITRDFTPHNSSDPRIGH